MKLINVKKGGIIYFENKKDEIVYIIKKGRVQLKKTEGYFLQGETMRKVKFLKDGDAFGFEDIFAGVKRTERATAVEDCELISFEIDDFAEVIKKNIKIGERVVNSLAGRIRELNNKIRSISRTDDDNDYQYSSNEIKDIYFYYLKKGEFKKSFEILQRMVLIEEFKKCAESEIIRYEKYISNDIDNKTLDEIIKEYSKNEKDKQILYFILEGLKLKIVEKELHERIVYEKLQLIKNCDRDEYIRRAKEYFESYPESVWTKILMFDIIEIYEKDGEAIEQLTVVSKLSEKKLSKDEIKNVKEKLEKLKKKVTQG